MQMWLWTTTGGAALSPLDLSSGAAEGEESDGEEGGEDLDRGQFANFTFVAEDLLHTRNDGQLLTPDLYQSPSSPTPQQPPSAYAQHPPYEPAPLHNHIQSPAFHSNHWQIHPSEPHPA